MTDPATAAPGRAAGDATGRDGSGFVEVDGLVVRYGDAAAVDGVSFSVGRGELVTLLGASGCGKTTTLRAVAGLEQPSAGEIRIGGRAVYSAARRVNVPTEQRDVSLMFQSYAIWPHMTVFENVAYGLKVRKRPADEIAERVRWALDLVQLGGYADRGAARLSGGQQQRVALARSVVFSPAVLLLDEPLSNLDAKLRAEMRTEIRDLQRRLGITAIYVTHDQEEALAISDRVIVMRAGRIEQVGSPEAIYFAPRNAFVADFVGGANLLRGRLRRDLARDGRVPLELPSGDRLLGVEPSPVHHDEAVAAVRTAAPRLHAAEPAGLPNAWPARIARRSFVGDHAEYRLEWAGPPLVVRRPAAERFAEGDRVWFSVDPDACLLLDEV